MSYVFFRNDDIRDTLDDELVVITDICVRNKYPIWLAIEPENVSENVCEWLIKKKKESPDFVFLIQHGLNHNRENQYPDKTEFGWNRSYEDQFESLYIGKKLMDTKFNSLWTPIISFPYGAFNNETLIAASKIGYIATATSIKYNIKSRLKNAFGVLVRSNTLFGKRISYHLKRRPRIPIIDVAVSVNLIQKYLDEYNAIHYSINDLKNQIKTNIHYTSVVGVLLHHRFHTNQIELIEELIRYLQILNVKALPMDTLFNAD